MRRSIRSNVTVRLGIVLAAFVVMALAAGSVSAQESDSKRPVDRVLALSTTKSAPPMLKIVGGQPAQAGRYPFQVALIASFIPEGREHFGQFCGGALVDQRWVLTAAHCVPDTEPDEIDVYIGSTVLPAGGTVDASSAGVRMSVDQVIPHDDYEPATHDNDIALLKLIGPAPDQLRTAEPATGDLEEEFGAVGADVTVIGWGALTQGGSTTPTLMDVVVQMQDTDLCEDNYQLVLPSADITENMFCAGVPQGGQDSCQGDSGGFIGAHMEEGNFVQLGVVSWGIGCAQPGLFGVYTRVANYGDWIDETMEEN